MYRKFIVLAIAAFILAGTLSGCHLRRRDTDVMENVETFSPDELEDGYFYVLHEGKFSKAFQNYATFDTSDNPSGKTPGYSLWYNDEEYSLIPTLYEGDQLIYYTTGALNDEFVFDRYADMGWTFGVANLEESPSGRFYFYTTPQNGNSLKCLYPKSSIGEEFQQYPGYKLFIDTIQDVPLKSGNISEGGTIIGLTKGSVYNTEVYAGTKLRNAALKADTFTATFMASYKVTDMNFLQSTILEICLPDWFENGYYNVNGKGLFRYVKGSSYDETTSFNVPNNDPSTTEDDPVEYEELEGETEDGQGKDTAEAEVTIETAGATEIYMKFGEVPEGNSPSESFYPDAQITVGEETFSFEQFSNKELVFKGDLEAGTYRIYITNLAGREYEFEVR